MTSDPALFDLAPAPSAPASPLWPHTKKQWADFASTRSPAYWASVWADDSIPDGPEPLSLEEEEQFYA